MQFINAISGFAILLANNNIIRERQKMYREAETTSGRILGLDHGPVLSFKGIPYGAPTGGANRFMPPRPADPWTGVRPCIGHGAVAPQAPLDPCYDFANLLQFNVAASIGGMGEDCLNLNIWTPALRDGGKRPVLVSFHGGAFNNGSSNLPLYDGAHLAARSDVVIVTVNHRLNAFGYLDLSATGAQDEFASSGVVGLLDLVEALRWVHDNAEHFGGDPEQVTIFGQSGGGWKTSCLLAMPTAKALFHRAMIQSGSLLRVQSKESSLKLAATVLLELGIDRDNVRAIQDLPWTAYHQAAAKVGLHLFEPVLDDTHLPIHPGDPLAIAQVAVPVIIGTTLDDSSFLYADPALDEATMCDQVRQRFGARADDLLAHYRQHLPDLTPYLLLGRIITDAGFRRFAHVQSERIAANGDAALYTYQWNWTTPAFDGVYGAAHAGDIPATFYNTEQALIGAGSIEGRMLADHLSQALVNFARTGHPGDDRLQWPKFNLDDRKTMIFDRTIQVVSDPDAELRGFWTDVPIAETVYG